MKKKDKVDFLRELASQSEPEAKKEQEKDLTEDGRCVTCGQKVEDEPETDEGAEEATNPFK